MSDKIELPDVDEDRASNKLGWREKMAFRLLWLMFCFIYPAKYQHQMKGLYEELTRDF